ncbi:hypothetical protein BDC45DRAFT_605022 [Circinella umbellata]|nr:hypothetical protein BDC45DRAFT_605022 [Circinella umbellata]
MGYDNALKETIIDLGKRSQELDVQLRKNDNSEASSSKKVKPSQQETETNEDEQEQLPLLNDINEAEAYKKVVLTLYKSAKDIVLKRQNAKNMSIYEYKIMASGFSGILDLVDKSDESGQARFFTTEFFKKWSNHLFNKHYIIINNKEEDHLQSFITWRVVARRHSIRLLTVDYSGESVSRHSSITKKNTYPDKKNTVSFKIDCRFMYDYNGQEYDLGVGELSKQNPGDDKLFGDKGKFLREGKEVIDGLTSTLYGRHNDELDGLEVNAPLVHESIMDIISRTQPIYFIPPGDLLQIIDPKLFTYELFPELPTTSETSEQGAKDHDQDEAIQSADENGWI